MSALELRFHAAMPAWRKIVGLKIRAVPECEGGGYMIEAEQAHLIAAASEMLAALHAIASNTSRTSAVRKIAEQAIAKAAVQ